MVFLERAAETQVMDAMLESFISHSFIPTRVVETHLVILQTAHGRHNHDEGHQQNQSDSHADDGISSLSHISKT